MFPKENLLAFWKLDNLTDSRGNRYTLTNVNGVTFASGKIGQGAVFQLGRSLEALFSPPVPYASGNFSISCWLKLNTLTNGGKFGADGTINAFTFGSLTNGTVYIGNNSGNNAIVSSSSGAITTGQWYHLCGVSSGGVVSFYLNGTLIGSNPHTFTSAPKISIAYTYSDNVTDGMFDAVGIWDRPLTLQEVQALYNNGNGLEPEGILFLEDSSTNDFQLTLNGDAKLNTTITKYGGGSAYFDGNGDYIEIPYDSGFDYGTGDFTVEFWVNFSSLTASGGFIGMVCGSVENAMDINYDNSLSIGVHFITTRHTFPWNPSINTWYHVAVCRADGNTKAFIDGVQIGTTKNDSGFNYSMFGGNMIIGRGDDNTNSFNGYIDDLRITKGIARYTSNFTPPAQQLLDPSDSHGDKVSLLLHMDGADSSTTFTDSSANNFALTAFGNAQIDTSIKKFGSGAALFDGNGDYLTIEDNNVFVFNTGFNNYPSIPFTVEAWIYPTALNSSLDIIISKDTYGSNFSWCIGISQSSLFCYTHNINSDWDFTVAASPQLNTWQHVALTMDGTTQRLFLNGQLLGTKNAPITNGSSKISIGSGSWNNPAASNSYFNGYIDELRITKGVARYTTNFVPQTAPFANPVSEIPRNGLLVRFNADSGISESGGNITSWTDQQNGVVATAFNNPTLLTNEFNGRKAVSFNGSDTYFTFTFPTPISDGAPRTFVVIGRYNNPTSTGQQGYLNSTLGDLCYVFKNSNEDRSYYYTEARQIAGPTAASSSSLASYHVQTVVHNGIPNSNFIRINGVTSYNISYGTMNNLPQLANIVIGGRGTPSEILSGQIVEILVYNRELSSEEITQIETYANI
jgi:hypothetical protein